jgi:hypothetical protein
MQVIKSKSFRFAFVLAFFVCFLGVMSGFERAIIDVLVVGIGMLIGHQGGMTFRRWRGDFKS